MLKSIEFFKANFLAILVVLFYLLIGFLVIGDYGPIIDSEKNYKEGDANLDYLLYRKLDPQIILRQDHGALVFIISALLKRILSDKFHILDPIAARHSILIVLSAVFLFLLYLFVKKHWDSKTAILVAITFITFPYYFGHSFNNLKDVPLLIFFSLSIFSFVTWFYNKVNIRYLYSFFIFFGLALSVKINALLIPVILLIWLLFLKTNLIKLISDFRKEIAIGSFLVLFIVLLFYEPSFWGVDGKFKLINLWSNRMQNLIYHPQDKDFNLFSFTQVVYRTPFIILVFTFVGIAVLIKNLKKSSLNLLLLFWMFIPLIIPCLPYMTHYNGMRHYLVFIVPFLIVSGLGLKESSLALSTNFNLNEKLLRTLFSIFLVLGNLNALYVTHPYETTFFNALAGGLKGAQEKNIMDSNDYWLNSYKAAATWLNKYAKHNSNVFTLALVSPTIFPWVNILELSLKRDDIKVVHLTFIEKEELIPGNSYVLFVPFSYLIGHKSLLSNPLNYKVVHKIKSQDGEILTIYYKK